MDNPTQEQINQLAEGFKTKLARDAYIEASNKNYDTEDDRKRAALLAVTAELAEQVQDDIPIWDEEDEKQNPSVGDTWPDDLIYDFRLSLIGTSVYQLDHAETLEKMCDGEGSLCPFFAEALVVAGVTVTGKMIDTVDENPDWLTTQLAMAQSVVARLQALVDKNEE